MSTSGKAITSQHHGRRIFRRTACRSEGARAELRASRVRSADDGAPVRATSAAQEPGLTLSQCGRRSSSADEIRVSATITKRSDSRWQRISNVARGARATRPASRRVLAARTTARANDKVYSPFQLRVRAPGLRDTRLRLCRTRARALQRSSYRSIARRHVPDDLKFDEAHDASRTRCAWLVSREERRRAQHRPRPRA
jgi:hypothetical protein